MPTKAQRSRPNKDMDAPGTEHAGYLLRMSGPQLRMRELNLPGPLPGQLQPLAALLTRLLMPGLEHAPVLLTVRGRRGRLWELGETPFPDDVVRTLLQGEPPQAMAFAFESDPPEGLLAERCITIAVESTAGRADILVALGGPQPRTFLRHAAGETNRWLGVSPSAEVDVW